MPFILPVNVDRFVPDSNNEKALRFGTVDGLCFSRVNENAFKRLCDGVLCIRVIVQYIHGDLTMSSLLKLY
jgi:hypothetical protein